MLSNTINLKHAVDNAAAEFEAARVKLEEAKRAYSQAQQSEPVLSAGVKNLTSGKSNPPSVTTDC